MQEKSADCSKNCTFLVESPKDVQRDNVQSTKGKGQDNSQKSGQSPKAKRAARGDREGKMPEKGRRQRDLFIFTIRQLGEIY